MYYYTVQMYCTINQWYLYKSFVRDSREICVLISNDRIVQYNNSCIDVFPRRTTMYHAFNHISNGADSTHFITEFFGKLEVPELPRRPLRLIKVAAFILKETLTCGSCVHIFLPPLSQAD